ncbi:hypothetical protein [Streptomyces hokutonensis]|uniref:hypothetical protein n=1 Tax=Streptomyces hokutonensis TaxID=1306990 RepID=UPI00037D972B|nr:hypothetical protein [Streptomyces hokutonensis]
MTTTTPAAEVDVPKLGELLVRNAKSDRDRTAAQALAEEETLLAHDGVRTALVVKQDGRMTAVWDRLMGRLYTLSLDDQQRAFLGLVLSMVGIGHVSLTAVESLDERRLLILQRAILRLAGNDQATVGARR